MEITLKLKLSNTKYATESREAFWSEFCRQAGLPFQPDEIFSDRVERVYSSIQMESLLWQKFMPRLNDLISYRYGNRGDGPGRIMLVGGNSPPLANIAMTLQRVEYNSLDLIMKVFGLEDASLLPLLAAALEIYSPDALEQSLPGNNVSVRARVEFDNEFSKNSSSRRNTDTLPPESGNVTGRNEAALQTGKRLWTIINSSLLLPLLLALAITYVAFEGVLEEKSNQLKQEAILSQERTVILNGLLQQNAALHRTLTEMMHPSSVPAKSSTQSDSQNR